MKYLFLGRKLYEVGDESFEATDEYENILKYNNCDISIVFINVNGNIIIKRVFYMNDDYEISHSNGKLSVRSDDIEPVFCYEAESYILEEVEKIFSDLAVRIIEDFIDSREIVSYNDNVLDIKIRLFIIDLKMTIIESGYTIMHGYTVWDDCIVESLFSVRTMEAYLANINTNPQKFFRCMDSGEVFKQCVKKKSS